MAINRISGNILADNLVRGSALAFQTDLLYIDVINGNLGVNTVSATHTLTVNGNCNILGPFQANDIFSGGNVTANVGNFTDLVVGNIDIGNLIGGGNLIVDSVTANLYLSALGNVTGANIVATNTVFGFAANISGNVQAANLRSSGSVFAAGNIIGDIGKFAEVSATGNVIGGNLTTAGNVSAAGNVNAGNVATIGTVSATGNVTGGNITTPGDISAAGNIFANNFSSVGNISLGNLSVSNTTITTTLGSGNITLKPTGGDLVFIDTVTGLVVPVGNTAQRPSPVSAGALRFNTDDTRLEFYDGAEWDSVVSDVTNQTLNGDGSTVAFTLSQSANTAATLVIVNGLVQLPITAYSITGNTLTFTQAPTVSDTIDIRFL